MDSLLKEWEGEYRKNNRKKIQDRIKKIEGGSD